jgi:hypothetical protein
MYSSGLLHQGIHQKGKTRPFPKHLVAGRDPGKYNNLNSYSELAALTLMTIFFTGSSYPSALIPGL